MSERLRPTGAYLTVQEMAAELAVSVMTIYRLINSGELDAIRIGRSFRVPRTAWNRFLADHTVRPS